MILICLLLTFAACSDDGAAPTDHNAGEPDAGDESDTSDAEAPEDSTGHDADAGDGPDTDSDCVCDDEGPCCDGCDAIDVGEECDDGLDCTLDTTCQADGSCGGAEATPCDDQLDHPDCQSAECDETDGCSIESIREGLDCDAEGLQPGTGQCVDGECVGEPCECDSDEECCDGCTGINDGEPCDDEPYGYECASGACVEAPCDCDDADDPCCDGCYWTEGEACTSVVTGRSCVETDQCEAEYEETVCQRFCQASDNYECTDINQECETITDNCSTGYCEERSGESDACVFQDSCL